MTSRVTLLYANVLGHGDGKRATQLYANVLGHGGSGGLTIPIHAELIITPFPCTGPRVTHQRVCDAANLIITTFPPEVLCDNKLRIITFPPDCFILKNFQCEAARLIITTFPPEIEVCRIWIRELPEAEYPGVLTDWEICP
jgi:hypothetical protein